jgi:hypothetical protein
LIAAAQAGGVRIAMLLDAQIPAALDSIKRSGAEGPQPYIHAERLRIPSAVVVTSAMRPGDGDATLRWSCTC